MGDTTERIVTILTTDVTGLEAGERRSAQAYDKMIAKNRQWVSQLDDAVGASGQLGGAISKLSALAGRAASVGGVFGSVLVAGIYKARQESERAALAVEEIGKNAVAAANRLSTLTKDSDIGSLAKQLTQARQNSRALRDEEEKRRGGGTLHGRLFADLGRGYNNVKDFLSVGVSAGDTNRNEKQQLELASKQAAQDELNSQKAINEALTQQASIAQKLYSGRTDEAALDSLEIQRKREILDLAKETGVEDGQIAAINAKYAAQVFRIREDRARIVRDAQTEAGIAEMLRKGETDRAAIEQQRLRFVKEREAVVLGGNNKEQMQALLQSQDSQGRQLRAAQGLEQSKFGSGLAQSRVGSDLSLGDTQREFAVGALKLDMLQKELAVSKEAGVTDERRRAIQIETLDTENQLARLRAQYRTQQAEFGQRGRELGISGNLQMGGSAKDAEIAKTKLAFAIEMSGRKDIGEEKRRQYQLDAKEAANALAAAKARMQTERDTFEQRKKELGIQGSNSPTKAIESARSKVSYLKSQLQRDDISDDERRSLTLELGGAQNDLRMSKQDRDFALRNRPGDRNARDAKEAREQTERDKFDARQQLLEETGSVIGGDRGSSMANGLFGNEGGSAGIAAGFGFGGTMLDGPAQSTGPIFKTKEAKPRNDAASVLQRIETNGLKIR